MMIQGEKRKLRKIKRYKLKKEEQNFAI